MDKFLIFHIFHHKILIKQVDRHERSINLIRPILLFHMIFLIYNNLYILIVKEY